MNSLLKTALALSLLATLGGCRERLASAEFIRHYEDRCAVTVERDGYRFLLLYQSAEYLAAGVLGPDAKQEEIVSQVAKYNQAHYVRISIRPPMHQGGEPGAPVMIGSDPLLPYVLLGERLRAAEANLKARIKLYAKNGQVIPVVSVALQRGLKSGAANVIMAVFPKEHGGMRVDLEKSELVIEDLGLNLGTLRKKLNLPKGFQLKVAT